MNSGFFMVERPLDVALACGHWSRFFLWPRLAIAKVVVHDWRICYYGWWGEYQALSLSFTLVVSIRCLAVSWLILVRDNFHSTRMHLSIIMGAYVLGSFSINSYTRFKSSGVECLFAFDSYDIILGIPFLRSIGVVYDWSSNTIYLKKDTSVTKVDLTIWKSCLLDGNLFATKSKTTARTIIVN